MREKVSTVIVEPRALLREALVCLMESHSYRVAGAIASALDIDDAVVANAPKLTILAATSVTSAACEATAIKRLWPGTRVILLFEQASAADLNTMLTSQIDACMPFFVSPGTFGETLQHIQKTGFRTLLMGPFAPATAAAPLAPLPSEAPVTRPDKNDGDSKAFTGVRQLSGREQQILKDLAKGHSNKMIARTCSLAEATVKVHIKSILRKIRVVNRTQAAIWALENVTLP